MSLQGLSRSFYKTLVPRALESTIPCLNMTYRYTFERENHTLFIRAISKERGAELNCYSCPCKMLTSSKRMYKKIKLVEVQENLYFTIEHCNQFVKIEKLTGQAIELSPSLFGRSSHCLAVLRDRYILQVGSINFYSSGNSKSSEIYDITTNVWTRLPDLNFHSQ